MPKFGSLPVHDHADAPGGGTIAHSATTGQVATDHHTAAILESLLTTRGDTIQRDASGPVRLAVGTDDQHYRSDGTDVLWETVAGGSGALTLAGSNTTEATTTSTTTVDLLTVASLTIAATTPILVLCCLRKTTGAAADAEVGLKLNSTEIRDPFNWAAAQDAARSGIFQFWVGPRVTNHLQAGMMFTSTSAGSTTHNNQGGAAPNAETTDVIILASVDNALITMGVDEMHVYELATS